MKKLIHRGVIDEVTGEEEEPVMDACIWCDRKVSKDTEVYVLGASTKQKAALEGEPVQHVVHLDL